ncbi:MAG: hypothetical protein UU40_C0006G0004 [Candidatus Uhrbacteria bacterium GW2011_GWD2_41_121]|uniref:DUF8128 domain-containing protein n=1 Tax=Candidatus Uhrbacteria bacterium GW2011_GWC1_41_20 TaxID=1618983 RepID=A0A0G0VEH2_9BACT|nr:MAG: hypothetical protein UT52_C0009G0004 [Candidatus Uhrbacteria bacterium GW2011_GWE1_39_46]KKR63961.1 MAG: hypothetical protein UU04_C0008G0004 [Candidatus Uhrbacteria bacterium GW2011_GWC2_40_450]KKR90220.1 MAG: hypothetical protein UU40_C0006G0004 [Candidatus Uhrbacteria bacterium GW2011_GWD2_41_121]KKR90269.1 MAG: hypothetical protein UU36_C0008G0004 [Candidatus Uhrbacteria bacterium GW2011_GWE2_41_1153]KKR95534.1 MAG: hypothetical protein UU46_C0021G0004 [Candidatus Uhrbacteria bacter
MLAIWELFQNYINTTPPDVVATDIVLYIGWFPVFCILVWGFTQVWIDIKQGQYWDNLKWDLLTVTIPADAIHSVKGIENFFNNLSGSKSAITWKEKWLDGKFQAYFSFEIISNGGQVQYYIRTIKKYRDLVEAALYAQYPDAQIIEVEDYINLIPDDYPNEEYECFGSELSLSKKEHFPIKRYVDFEHAGEKDLRFKDPLLPMLEMLGKMKPGEFYWIQMLIIGPDSQDWKKDAIKWMKKQYGIEEPKKKGIIDESVGWIPGAFAEQLLGRPFGASEEKKADDFRMWKMTPDEQDTLKAVGQKQKEIGWYSKIRFVYVAKKELFRKGTIASMTKGIFLQYDSGMNKLSLTENVTTKDDYFFQAWQMPGKQKKLVDRYKNRLFGGTTPYILTASELATLWHFPGPDARTPVLTSLGARMAEAPRELGYAPNELSILPNFERSATDVEGSSTMREKTADYIPESPTPHAPTQEQDPYPVEVKSDSLPVMTPAETFVENKQSDDMPVFRPGMPAPLPPGLDLSDLEKISNSEPPESLPV